MVVADVHYVSRLSSPVAAAVRTFSHAYLLFNFSLFGNLVKYFLSTFVFKVKVVGFILFQISTQNSVSYM